MFRILIVSAFIGSFFTGSLLANTPPKSVFDKHLDSISDVMQKNNKSSSAVTPTAGSNNNKNNEYQKLLNESKEDVNHPVSKLKSLKALIKSEINNYSSMQTIDQLQSFYKRGDDKFAYVDKDVLNETLKLMYMHKSIRAEYQQEIDLIDSVLNRNNFTEIVATADKYKNFKFVKKAPKGEDFKKLFFENNKNIRLIENQVIASYFKVVSIDKYQVVLKEI